MIVDGGAAVNLMPYAMFRKLGRNVEDLIKTNMVLKDFGGNPSETKGVLNVELTVGSKTIPTTFFVIDGKGSYSLLLGRDWIHANCCIPSTMHQCLIQWQGDKREIVPADRSVNVASFDLALWEMDGLDCLSGKVWDGDFLKVSDSDIQPIEDGEPKHFEGVVEGSNVYAKDTVDDLDDKQGQGFMSADELEEIDIGPGDRPRPTYISIKLSPEFRTKLIELLKDFRDCFAWEYYEMPGLSRSIVEHRLPIKPGVRPRQQPPRRCKADMLEPVKAEIKRLYDAGFIHPCRYAEWVSSIVLVIKKNGKVRVCIDFRDLNKATPKDEYPMPVADQLVDAASGNKILSFMDGNAGYNQIFMAEEDIHKTAFRCPDAIGLFEWVVMTFGLKSAGATYRRDMNYIYHDLIGWLVEVYIDDVVAKSKEVEDHIADLRKVFERTRKYSLKMNPTKCAFAEYEAVLKGLQLLKEVEADTIEIMGDSLLVISQLAGEYECKNDTLMIYNEKCLELMKEFRLVTLKHVSREQNLEANDLAQRASGYKPMIKDVNVEIAAMSADDWRYGVHQYLTNPSQSASRKLRYKALKYTLLDDEFYYRTIDGVLLKCLNADQAKAAIGEVHEGICGTHQSAHKMKWLLRCAGYFWPTMLENCFRYYKRCQDCQKFGAIQRAPASAINPIIKPWPFKGWRIDMIGMINPPSSKGHKFILVATNYFTKWVEAILLKKVDSGDAIQFVQEHIIYRFGLPQTITTDQGSIFVSDEFVQFADSVGIKLLNSSPYYAQANGQAEASNKSLIKLMKRKISDYPRQWHTRLAEALWSYRMACHGSIQVPPYKLVYGHEAVLPWEVRIGSQRMELQNDLTANEYYNLMADEREDLVQSRLRALVKVTRDKERVARHYNKKVVPKDFSEGELVWKLILPIGTRDSRFGKWSPNWEGPFQIHKVVSKGAYMLQGLDGEVYGRALNGKYLKKYYPSVWVNA
nr:retrotransposon protein, putative, unclassified [Oryza sativa Japonica Group]ABG22462.1 retrotransposon protein, putative, unclassified [Oryza sativa Japonica Group]